jgi:hypothetical protein
MTLLRPLRETVALVLASRTAWLWFAGLFLFYVASLWLQFRLTPGFMNGSVLPLIFGGVQLVTTIVAFTARWLITRQFGGPDLPPGRFGPWFGVILLSVLLSGLSTVGLSMFAASRDPAFFQLAIPVINMVVTIIMMPFMIWGAACALGRQMPVVSLRDLPAPGPWGYLLCYAMLQLVFRGSVMASQQLVAQSAALADILGWTLSPLLSAIILILDVAFLTAAALHLGRGVERKADIFA